MFFWRYVAGMLASLIIQTAACAQNPSPAPGKIVMITQILEHPALTAVRKGVIESLAKNGYDPSTTLDLYYENAHGNVTTAAQIAQKFAGSNPDVVVAISTPSAQSMVAAARERFPVVFAAVTDPLAAKIVKSLEKPGLPVTGVIDRAPFEAQLALVKAILKDKKRLGIVYNSGEINSVTALRILNEQAKLLGLEIVEGNASKSAEVGSTVQSIIHKVDAIFIPNDNTVVSSVDAVIKACTEMRIPLFAADITLVEKGVMAVTGYDYAEMGRKAGQLVVSILQGQDPRQLPVVAPSKPSLYINKKVAGKIGIDLPPDLLEKADKIF